MAQTEPPLPPELALPEASRGRQQAAAGRPQGSRGRFLYVFPRLLKSLPRDIFATEVYACIVVF